MSRLPPGTRGKGYGKPDCAHNNAGIAGLTSSTVGYAEADRDTIITIGLEGVSPCTKSEIPQTLAGGGGAIVNMPPPLG